LEASAGAAIFGAVASSSFFFASTSMTFFLPLAIFLAFGSAAGMGGGRNLVRRAMTSLF
jgi:hypothetical protein